MKGTKLEQQIYNVIELEFCKFLSLTSQKVTDAMNASPCPLGSEKHFEQTAKNIVKVLNKSRR